MLKLKNYIFIALLFVLVALVAVLALPRIGDDGTVSVGVAVTEGLSVKGDNPVKVNKGTDAVFELEIEDGYFIVSSDSGTVDGNTLTVSAPERSKTVRLTLGKMCEITVVPSGKGGAWLAEDGKVKSGETATVKLSPDENYEVAEITVDGKKYPVPSNDEFSFAPDDNCTVNVVFAGRELTFMAVTGNLGSVSVLNRTDVYRYGDILNLSCTYDREHIVFGGWSAQAYLSEGGTLLSSSEEYAYELTENTVLYANFTDRTSYSLIIDKNGGSLLSDINGAYAPGQYVNLPVDSGALVRAGYNLIGFNSAPDGTGEQYSLGAMLEMPRSDLTLYAVWAAETDVSYLEYHDNGTGITIDGFSDAGKNANIKVLSVPASINGKKTTVIAAGAFRKTALETVILPTGVTTVYSAAFSDCTSLKTVYFPETLTYLANDAFERDYSFSDMRVTASLSRVFDYDYDSALADKFMRLKNTDGKRIVIVGGSSASFGLNSAMIKDSFPDYTVINFSCSAFYGILPIFEMLKNEVHEGDIVIFAPEYYYLMYAYGETDSITNWQYLESNYDILCDIDIRNTPMLLSTFTSYLSEKRAYLPYKKMNSDNVYVRSAFNQAGDLTSYRSNKYIYGLEVPPAAVITETGMSRFNSVAAYLAEKGARCAFSFPPQPSGGVSKAEIRQLTASFTERLTSMLDSSVCPVISNIEDYFFDPQLFYDGPYHMTLDGAELRTAQLVSDIAAFLGE